MSPDKVFKWSAAVIVVSVAVIFVTVTAVTVFQAIGLFFN